MSSNRPEQKQDGPWSFILIAALFFGVGGYVLKAVLADDTPRRKNSVTMVTLMKPPPAPPPEKEVPKEPDPEPEPIIEEVIAPEPQEEIVSQDDTESQGDVDDAPAGDNLGLDAEGTGGSDAFGLVGKKGGRSLLGAGSRSGGGMGRLSLLAKNALYIDNVNSVVQKKVMERLEELGWFPRGTLTARVSIKVDDGGRVREFSVIGSSGNHRMDRAISETLAGLIVSAPPGNKVTMMDIVIESRA